MEGERGVVLLWLRLMYSFSTLVTVISGSYHFLSWRGLVNLNEYSSMRDAAFFDATVPEWTWKAEWRFTAYKTEGCEHRTLHIEARHGSLPILHPNNESFPEDFNLQETSSWSQIFSTENVSFSYTHEDPMPGHWYVAYFINDYVDDSITQKGLGGLKCNYFMETEILVWWLDHVAAVELNEDVPVTVNDNDNQLYRVLISELTWQLEISVQGCVTSSSDDDKNSTSDSGCPLMISFRAEGLPQISDPNSFVKNCSGQDPCIFTINSVTPTVWNYIRFTSLHQGETNFSFQVKPAECDRHHFFSSFVRQGVLVGNVTTHSNQSSNATEAPGVNSTESVFVVTTQLPVSSYSSNGRPASTNTTTSASTNTSKTTGESNAKICVWLPQMARIRQSSQPFKTGFQLHYESFPLPNKLKVPEDQDVILKFALENGVDSGGTLKFTFGFPVRETFADMVGTVEACIQRGNIPTNETGCAPSNHLILSSSGEKTPVVYFPYPEPGPWYISLRSKCYTNMSEDTGMGTLRNCSGGLEVDFSVCIDRCVNDGCGRNGRCSTIYNGEVKYSACICSSGWRGFGCTDGTFGDTDAEQLMAVLFLTLSNLAFLPATILSLYRRLFLEALVYFFTMFFSTFYHACDGDGVHLYCMIPYNTLAVCDFYGAIMSFWVTLIAMSRLTDSHRSFLYMLAALALALGVTWDRHSLWTFLVPALVAFVIMVITWVLRMVETRSIYPSKKRWLFRLLPGILIALIGLCIYAFLETGSNYQFTHSAWHACMAFCIIFLLPPKRLHKDKKQKDGISIYNLDTSYDTSSSVYHMDNPGFNAENEIIQKF